MVRQARSVFARCAEFGVRLYSSNPVGPPAFCLDIDGVLKRGQHILPAALEAMKQVQRS
jgi:ribonucleotide monophosphatase NagD (HAD superfamily)